MDPVLECLSRLIQEIPEHWEPVVASIILTGTINFITAPTLEYQTQGMKVKLSFLYRSVKIYGIFLVAQSSPHANGYASFTRQLSGAAEAYALMLFPSSLPLEIYIQVNTLSEYIYV